MVLESGIFLLFILLVLVIIIYRIEWVQHQRNLKKISIRIMVNGTRGKSTVTRLIGAGIKAGGYKVLVKTTGTKPRMVINNSFEFPVIRPGKPNIKEQIAIVRRAVQEGVNVLVLENMSIRPDLQWVEESKIVAPNIVAITNVRSDHLDVMGPTLKDVAINFIKAVPKGAQVITAEKGQFAILRETAQKMGLKAHQAEEAEITEEEMGRFPYVEHRENVALALEVCKQLGIKKELALREMYNYLPDPGILKGFQLEMEGKKVTLYNALAANDPDSTFIIYERIGRPKEKFYLIVNCRADRIDRSLQMADLIRNKIPADLYFLTGGNTLVLYKKALKLGMEKARLIDLGGKDVTYVYSVIKNRIEDGATIMAIGNIVGYGERLIEYFKKEVR